MSGFYCGICGESKDETEANFWEDKIVCTSCLITIKEDEEIEEEAKSRTLWWWEEEVMEN